MKYVDLSYDLKSEMPVYPGDIELKSNKEKEYGIDFLLRCMRVLI